MKKLFTFLRILMVVVSILVLVAMAMSAGAAYIPPGKGWYIAFFGLGFIPLFALNFILLVFWIVVRFRHALIPLVAIIISLPAFFKTVGFHSSKANEKQTGKTDVRLMSFNVRNFDLYNWEKNNSTRDNIYKMLTDEQPDILCFQEFYTRDIDMEWNNEKHISKSLALPHHFFSISNTVAKQEHWGLCTFSRYPITGSGNVGTRGVNINACIYTDIETPAGVIRVYNIHLQSFHLSYKDYNVIDLKSDSSLNLESGKTIFTKMKHAWVTRGAQVRVIAEHIRASPYPVFVCGDFNDTPSSFAYNELRGNLIDAFLNKSWGIGYTYDYWMPIFRIDYLLIDPRWQVNNFKVVGENLSDHYPIECNLSKEGE